MEDRVLLTNIAYFHDQSALPSNMHLRGSAAHYEWGSGSGNHIIELTAPVANQLGSVLIDGPGHAVLSFHAELNIGLKDSTTGTPGDGMSFGYGSLSGGAFGEEGERHRGGLWISIDTYDNGDEVPGVSAWYGDTLLFEVQTPHAVNDLRGGWNRLIVDVSSSGVLQVQYLNSDDDSGGNLSHIVNLSGTQGVQIPNWAPQTHWGFGVGARTGAANDFHVIENFYIDENTTSSTPVVALVPTGTTTHYGPTEAPKVEKTGGGTGYWETVTTCEFLVHDGEAVVTTTLALPSSGGCTEQRVWVDGDAKLHTLETTNVSLPTEVDGTASGNGTFHAPFTLAINATLDPGESPGRLTFTDSTVFKAGSRLRFELNGTMAKIGYDQLYVKGANGTISLGGSHLIAFLGFEPARGQSFTIINNEGTDAVVGNLQGTRPDGTFGVLGEGAALMISGKRFYITYHGGAGGNDVVLTRNDTPSGRSDSFTVAEDGTLSGSALISDAHGGASAHLVTGPANAASFTLNSNGTFSYRPAIHWSGSDSFQYFVSDGEFKSAIHTVTIDVTPIADAPTLSVANRTGSENAPIPLGIASALVDADGSESLSITIAGVPAGVVLSAGAKNADGTWTLTPAQLEGLTLTSPDNAAFTLTVTATAREAANGHTAATVASFLVTVNNVAPALAVLGDQSIVEGALLRLIDIGTFTDSGFDNPSLATRETFRYAINWGDGTAESTGDATIDTAGGFGLVTTGSFDGSHTYADNGVYTVTVRLADDDMPVGEWVEKTFTVTVANVKPTLTVVGQQEIAEGALLSLTTLGRFTDPGFDNPANPTVGGELAETFSYTINWGDGTLTESGVPSRTSGSPGTATIGSFDGSHIYADNGIYTVTVRIADDDMPVDEWVEQQFTVVVTNAAPTLTVVDNKAIAEGSLLSLTNIGTFTDPGFDNAALLTQETFTYSINWGDGTETETGARDRRYAWRSRPGDGRLVRRQPYLRR